MASWIKKNIISVVQGDSLWTKLELTDSDNNPYVPDPNDKIRFALKRTTDPEEEPLVTKDIPYDTLELRLDPQDTNFPVGEYVYDVEIELTNGFVDTVVGPCRFKITDQVGVWR